MTKYQNRPRSLLNRSTRRTAARALKDCVLVQIESDKLKSSAAKPMSGGTFTARYAKLESVCLGTVIGHVRMMDKSGQVESWRNLAPALPSSDPHGRVPLSVGCRSVVGRKQITYEMLSLVCLS